MSELLASTLAFTPVGQWLEPDLARRRVGLRSFYRERIVEAILHGAVRLAVTADDEVIGAVVWLTCTEPNPLSCLNAAGVVDVAGVFAVGRRMGQLQDATWQPHSSQPHLRMLGLGVRKDHLRRGVATALLTDRRQGSARPVRCLAADEALAAVGRRCGYRAFCRPVQLRPGRVMVQPMAFVPHVSVVRVRNAAAAHHSPGASRERPDRDRWVVRPRIGGSS